LGGWKLWVAKAERCHAEHIRVWITHIVTWSGPAHRSQASMGGPPPEADKRLSVGYDVLTLRGWRCG